MKRYLPLAAALLFAGGVKTALVSAGAVPFNSDEAIVGLMARHILNGARPTFFYGQAYMGSLDAYLVAAGFGLLAEEVWVIRLVQGILFSGFLISLWWLVRRQLDESHANLAVWLAAVPPVLITTYTTASLGGYSETLLLGNLILLFGWALTGDDSDRRTVWFFAGAAAGLGFWVLGLACVYIFPIGLMELRKIGRVKLPNALIAGLGFVIASLPWWLYNFAHKWEALLVIRALPSSSPLLNPVMDHLAGFLVLGMPALIGIRFPWASGYLPWGLSFLGVFLFLAILACAWAGWRAQAADRRSVRGFWNLFFIGFLAAFLFTRFGVDGTGRYLLPLFVWLVLVSAVGIHWLWLRSRLAGALLFLGWSFLNISGTYLAATAPDRITTQFDPITRFDNSADQALLDFLVKENVTRGYSNYWVAYRLAFLSRENLIFAPVLPYKDDLSYSQTDNRYPAYLEIVEASQQSGLITSRHPVLDGLIEVGLRELGISYRIAEFGVYRVYYDLSHKVTAADLTFEPLDP